MLGVHSCRLNRGYFLVRHISIQILKLLMLRTKELLGSLRCFLDIFQSVVQTFFFPYGAPVMPIAKL